MSLILTILGFAAAVVLLALLALVVLSGLGVIAAGKGLEWIFDVLVPARRTGLGPEGLIGRSAEVTSEFVSPGPNRLPEGSVRVSGEIWKARVDSPVLPAVNQQVQIVEIDGLVAVVTIRD